MNNRPLSFLVLCVLILSSCIKLVQDKFPDFQPIPTVNSILVADSILKIHISLASKLDSTPLEYVNNAVVLLYVDDLLKDSLIYSGQGIYTSNTIIRPLHNYRCLIIIPGFKTITCTNSIPQPTGILNVEHINIAGKDEEGITFPAIKFTFKNKLGEKRYYEAVIRLLENGKEEIAEPYNQTDPILLNEGLPLTSFSNDFISDSIYTMTINYSTGETGSINGEEIHTILYPLILELRSVSFDYYQYVKQLYLYEKGRYPDFTESVVTPFPLFSNIKDSYGIFAGYSSFVSDTINPLKK
jgi:hypothetical protein